MVVAIRIDVVVVVIDRVHENTVFMHFVGMLVGSWFKRFSIFEVGQKLQLDCDLGWGKGWRNFPSRAGSREVSHTQIGWGKSAFF